jgi:hypothetical protein
VLDHRHNPSLLLTHLLTSDNNPAGVADPITFTATDRIPLSLKINQLPASSPFSLSGSSCPDLARDQSCSVTLSEGQSIGLDILYRPQCIGTHTDSISFTTDVNADKVSLQGAASLASLTFVRLSDGRNLATAGPVTPNSSIDLGLDAAPGYCIGQTSQQVTGSIVYERFVRAADPIPVTYDERIRSCPANVPGCLATLQTGTVAGDIYLYARFLDRNQSDVGYPGGILSTEIKVNVPAQKPVIQNLAKGTVSGSSFQLNVTGYSTPRNNTEACFRFAAAPGTVLNAGALNNCYAKDDIAVWFERNSSFATGSQFTRDAV